MIKVSSGVRYLDELINRFNIGDNVVWQVETGAFVELFCRAFIRESVKEGKEVVYVSFNNSPKNILAKMGSAVNSEHVVIVDCFTSGKGDNSNLFLDLYKTTYKKYNCKVIHVEKPEDAAGFVQTINRIEETKPRGARYVFDSITGMQDLWGGSEAAKFFTRQCPRLYELDTIAYWIIDRNVHAEQFRAQLNHITQVVIDLSVENGLCNLLVRKAENHPESGMLKPHRYEVVNSTIEFTGEADTDAGNIGRKIRDIRLKKEISQAQLAAEMGVTPSTISQVESNAISLSLPALLRLTRALNISIGSLFDEKQAQPAHFLFRAKSRAVSAFRVKDVTFDSILPEHSQDGMEAYVVNMAPGAEIDSHLYVSKGKEFGFILSGAVEMDMKGRTYTVNEGDAVYFTADVPSGWRNTSDNPARMLLVVAK